jgi:hypothetical protein
MKKILNRYYIPINTTVNCLNRQLPKNCREIDIVAEIGQLTAICPKSLPYVSHNFVIKVSFALKLTKFENFQNNGHLVFEIEIENIFK